MSQGHHPSESFVKAISDEGLKIKLFPSKRPNNGLPVPLKFRFSKERQSFSIRMRFLANFKLCEWAKTMACLQTEKFHNENTAPCLVKFQGYKDQSTKDEVQ